ncbi:MAG: hypothetical protein HFH06_08855 [Lachnospiraceae bacterium]|nr:hypothetical protein [Lachnospiraceae bacterium]
MENTKKSIIKLIDELLDEKELELSDFRKYAEDVRNITSPKNLKWEMEQWYRTLGIEYLIGKKFELSECPFSEKEIICANENNEVILCVPKGITREILGQLFHIESWALHDPLVMMATEQEDCWFKTSMKPIPDYLNMSGLDVFRQIEDENYLNFSLERYLVFIARMRYITGKTPDSEYWIWLPVGRYDRSGMLMAGFDKLGRFNVHGWMPRFQASFLGARFGVRI